MVVGAAAASELHYVKPPERTVADTIPTILTELFPPDADVLLARCAALVTDGMLAEISEADVPFQADANLAALLPIRNVARVPSPMVWEPREVLSLVRWCQPEDPIWEPYTGERGHIMRAFCCAALLRAAPEPENAGSFEGENETLIQLIDSVLFLNRGLPEAAGHFLAWRIPLLSSDDEVRPFFAFGLVALVLLVRRERLSGSDVDTLVYFVEQCEAASRDAMGTSTPEMLRGSFLTRTLFNQRHGTWQALAAQLRLALPDSERVVALARRIEAA